MDTKAVLYVEDNAADVFLIERAWETVRIPHSLFIVRDGQEAAHYLAGTGRFADSAEYAFPYPFPDLMLLDLKLPRMSGIELLNWIRHHNATRDLRVVVLSSSSLAADIEQAKPLGVSDYWVKPNDSRKLQEMVASL